MNDSNTNQPAGMYNLDFRTARCKCGSPVRPYESTCLQCGRKQNLLFEGLEKLPIDDLESFIKNLEKEVENRSYDYIKLFRLGNAHLVRGRFEIAKGIYEQILKKKPDFNPARLNLGLVLACLGDSDAACAELKQYVRQDPHSPKAERIIRAICSIRNIPYEDALEEIQAVWEPSKSKRISEKNKWDKAPKRKRSWNAIDIFLAFLLLMLIAGWFILPDQTHALVNSAVRSLEKPFSFEVKSQLIDSTNEADEQQDIDKAENEDTPRIVNLNTDSKSYFPLKAGNKWHYTAFDTRDPSGESSRRPSGGRTITVLGLENEKENIWKVRNAENIVLYQESEDGLYSVEDKSASWSSRFIQIPYPPIKGKSMTTLGQTVTVEDEEDITTPAGTFRCVRIKYSLEEPSSLTWTAWYGKGIGLVKYRGAGLDGMYRFLELNDYEIK